ncbi:hypothetical protein [Nocardioides sp. URHA0020]|uniref:hypothetical protein n=1 Tax=Nocardioides sp. URHA0020 TaxID=1380392 RepID=UPI00048AFBDB|nr:hypothetical protein [Nocardioides sp. URHA0020]
MTRALWFVLGLALTAAVAVPLPADGAVRLTTYAGAVAELHVDAQAYEGQRGTILAGLRGRCLPGYRVAELTAEFSQGDVVTPVMQEQPFPCDGLWHRQRVTSLEAFEPGPATLTVRASVVPLGGGAAQPVSTTAAIYVRPAAKIELPATVELRPHAVVKVTLRARCDAPWVLQDFSITARQGEFPSIASDSRDLDLTCDGVLHPITLWLKSSPVPFHAGWLRLDGSITLLDPEQFDPVTQATSTRVVRVG